MLLQVKRILYTIMNMQLHDNNNNDPPTNTVKRQREEIAQNMLSWYFY